jgi:hypothetical protein
MWSRKGGMETEEMETGEMEEWKNGEKEEWRQEEWRNGDGKKGDMANKKNGRYLLKDSSRFFVIIFENYSDKLNFI